MAKMTHRERVKAAVDHRTPDRVPLDIGGSNVTTMVDTAYERLKAYLGIEAETVYLSKRARQVVLDEVTAQRLGTDTRPLFLGPPDSRPDVYHSDGSVTDEWQVNWRCAGEHYIPAGNPLVNATIDDLDGFPWPDPDDPGRTRGLGEQARHLHEETDYAVILTLPVAVVHLSQYLRGYEQYLIDLVTNTGFAEQLMDRIMEIYLGIVSNALDAVSAYVDVVTFGDDVAFQDRPMVRPTTYRELIKPRHQQITDLIKSKTDAAVLYHCCGSVYSLIPDFIEMGMDALNPVQVSAMDMDDTARLKREFGADICFWGGVDTQRILPYGTPDEVHEEVRRRINDVSASGGYVLAAVHDIQEDVPPENIVAMAEAVREFGEVH